MHHTGAPLHLPQTSPGAAHVRRALRPMPHGAGLGVRNASFVAFYMYTDPALDHSWMRHCKGFTALRHSVNDTNTAEVGVHKLLHRHPARTFDVAAASLFYVPVFEYTSYSLGECNGTTHRSRMEAAATALRASDVWRRNGGADHVFATSAWSISGSSTLSLGARMAPLNTALSCGISGRYKAFGATHASAGAACSFEIPYQANLAATRIYRPRRDTRAPPRTTLVHFAGALDVCCTGRQIRCAIAPLYAAAATGALADAIVRPIIPKSLHQKPCTSRALQLALGTAANRSASNGRRLAVSATVWRWAVNNSDVDRMAREMASSVFCLSPAGRTGSHDDTHGDWPSCSYAHEPTSTRAHMPTRARARPHAHAHMLTRPRAHVPACTCTCPRARAYGHARTHRGQLRLGALLLGRSSRVHPRSDLRPAYRRLPRRGPLCELLGEVPRRELRQ